MCLVNRSAHHIVSFAPVLNKESMNTVDWFSSDNSCEAAHPAAKAYHSRQACVQALQTKLPRSENGNTNAITAVLM